MLATLRGKLMLLSFLIVTGYITWGIAPAPPETKPTLQSNVEPWSLPTITKAQPEKNVEILNKKSLWGNLPDKVNEKPLIDPEWRVLGIVTNGPDRFVLIKVEGQSEQRLGINDKLPGGSKILKIEEDRICLLLNGKKRILGINKMGPQVL